MNLFTRLIWRLMPARERHLLLAAAPDFQQRRIERMMEAPVAMPAHFDKHQCLYFAVPKAAGHSVNQGLFGADTVEHVPAEWYQRIEPDKFERYFKFTFVRNPWDRAVSAYSFLRQGGSPYREDDRQWQNFVNRFASFDEFVCEWMNRENLLRHYAFTPQYRFLQDRFGMMNVDFVGRFESLQEDFATVAAKLGRDSSLPHLNKSRDKPYQHFYTERSQALIADLYREDIERFDYQFGD